MRKEKFYMINNIKKLRQRFVKDYNLPINIFSDDLFEYYMNLYHFFPRDVYNEIVNKVENEYNGNVEAWLEYCGRVRDNAIEGVMSSESYQKFNNGDMSIYNIPNICGERSCYSEATDGKIFVSIDLRKANFQALKYVGVITDNTYEDFIKKYGGDDYIANSKYLRQVIFGKMNPSRQIKVEKYLMYKVYEVVNTFMTENGYEVFSFNSDELIFEFKNNGHNDMSTSDFIATLKNLSNSIGVETKVELIDVKRLPIVVENGSRVDAYQRYNLIERKYELKKASTTYYPQIYKIWKDCAIDSRDLMFYFENQLAKFEKPLKKEEYDI